MQKSKVIYGPPGTGKTTRLIQELQNQIDSGVESDRIGVVSFTKAAATEISRRADAHGAKVSTLHSMAYKLADIQADQVVDRFWLAEFSKISGIPTQGSNKNLDELQEGDAYLALEAYMGATLRIDADVCFLNSPTDGTLEKWLYWHDAYNRWKAEYGVVDFNDMLTAAISQDPDLDVLILDEAQDFSPLQWQLIENTVPYVKEVIIAGDDDQAIYKWGGADPHGMARFETENNSEKVVLSQSYRVPITVYHLAQKIADRIGERVEKRYKPMKEEGQVTRHSTFSMLEVDKGEDVLILVRNHSLRKGIEDTLTRRGTPYMAESGFPAPLDNRYANAIRIWMQAARSFAHAGDTQLTTKSLRILTKAAKAMYKNQIMDDPDALVENDINWTRLLQIPPHFFHYYQAIIKKYGSLDVPTNIRISTIHGSKGREADRVILINGMGMKTAANFESDPDSEYRTFYVAVTRTKFQLDIVHDENPLEVLA